MIILFLLQIFIFFIFVVILILELLKNFLFGLIWWLKWEMTLFLRLIIDRLDILDVLVIDIKNFLLQTLTSVLNFFRRLNILLIESVIIMFGFDFIDIWQREFSLMIRLFCLLYFWFVNILFTYFSIINFLLLVGWVIMIVAEIVIEWMLTN
jgi:hypothetical protein